MKPRYLRSFAPFVSMAFCLAALSQTASAASQTWDGDTDATWATVTNWVSNTGAPGAVNPAAASLSADTATFNAALVGGTRGGSTDPITYENARQVRHIAFDTAAGPFVFGTAGGNQLWLGHTGSITMSADVASPQTFASSAMFRLPNSTNGTYSITNNATSSSATLSFARLLSGAATTRPVSLSLGGTNTGENVIGGVTDSGALRVTKSGASTWTVTGASVVTAQTDVGVAGGWEINGGTLAAAHNSALGSLTTANSLGVAINATGTLEIRNGITLDNGLSLNLNNGGTIKAVGTTGTNGRINVGTAAATSVTLTTDGASDVFTIGNGTNDLTGGASDSVINVSGPGTVYQNVASNYAGKWQLHSGTTLLGSDTALGAAASASVSFGASSTAVLRTNGLNPTIVGLSTNAVPGTPIIENSSAVSSVLTINNTTADTYAGTLADGSTGTLGITKGGAGALTLSGTNTYTGATAVDAGTLSLTGSLTSNIEANSGATITGTGSTTGSLTTNAGSSLLVKSAGGVLTASGGVNFAGATSLVFDGILTLNTTYDVVNYGTGALSNLSNLTATARGTVTDDAPNTKVTFTAGSSGTRTWNVTNGTWEIGGVGSNWLQGDNKFFNGDSVVFNNPASLSTVTLSGNLVPASVNVTNSTNGYVFTGSGSIGGTSTFTKQGSGTLEIATTNSYTGATTIGAGTVTLSGTLQNTAITVDNGAALNSTSTGVISGSASLNIDGNVILASANSYTGATTISASGTLQLGDGSTDGSLTGSSSITNDGSLTFNRLTDLSSAIPITGSGSVTKEGAGMLTLTAANSYNGGTTISAGTVRIGHINSFGSGTVDIGSGATVTNSANLSGAPGLANTFTGSGAFTAAAGSGLQVTLSGDWTAFTGTVSSSAGSGGDMVFNGAFSLSGVSVTTSEDAAYVNNYNVNNSNGMIVQNLTGSPVTYKLGSYASAVGSNLRNSGVATGSVIFEIGKLGTDTTVAGTIGGGAQSVSLTKVGAGTLTLDGLNTYTGATTVTGGVLTITKDDVLADISTVTLAASGSLNLTHSGTDTVTALIIGGLPQPNGLYTFGTGKLKVGLSTPFEDWAILKGLDGTAGKENGPADDPDKDGSTNLAEFAFNGNPLSGSDNGQIFVLTADSDDVGTDKELILTLAVRKTTPAFTAGAPATAPLTDGVNYSVHGSTDLASFGVTVTPVGFVDPGVALTDATNYEYRSFSLNGSNGLAGKGFLRAKAEAP